MNNWKNIWNNRDIDSITLDYLLNINGFSSEVGSFNPKSFDQYFKNIFQYVEFDRIKSCIEIGCGAGLFLYKLPSNIQKSGIDFSDQLISIAKKIINEFEGENIVILCRYPSQIKKIKNQIGKNAKVLSMTFDGKQLLEDSDVFIGSGGTMTAEASLLGTPTISYNAVPNIVERSEEHTSEPPVTL